jgi:hypothetical protein
MNINTPMPSTKPKNKVTYIKGLAADKAITVLSMDPYYKNFKFQMPGNNNLESFGLSDNCLVTNVCFNGEPCVFDIPDILINCMADGDILEERLKYLQAVIEQLLIKNPNLKIINHPTGVLKTSRDSISKLFQGLKNITVPKVVRIYPKSRKDIVNEIKNSDLKLPVLIRKAGGHGGYNLIKLDDFSEAQIEQLDIFAFDSNAMYVTEFENCQSQDGFFRKARIVMIKGKPHVRHLIISDEWNIHSRSRQDVMNKNPHLIEEEKNFISKGAGNFSKNILAGLDKIYNELKLDVFGIDAGIMPNGDILVFEINPAMEFIALGLKQDDYIMNNLEKLKKAYVSELLN